MSLINYFQQIKNAFHFYIILNTQMVLFAKHVAVWNTGLILEMYSFVKIAERNQV